MNLIKPGKYLVRCYEEECQETTSLFNMTLNQKNGIPCSYMLCPEHRAELEAEFAASEKEETDEEPLESYDVQ